MESPTGMAQLPQDHRRQFRSSRHRRRRAVLRVRPQGPRLLRPRQPADQDAQRLRDDHPPPLLPQRLATQVLAILSLIFTSALDFDYVLLLVRAFEVRVWLVLLLLLLVCLVRICTGGDGKTPLSRCPGGDVDTPLSLPPTLTRTPEHPDHREAVTIQRAAVRRTTAGAPAAGGKAMTMSNGTSQAAPGAGISTTLRPQDGEEKLDNRVTQETGPCMGSVV